MAGSYITVNAEDGGQFRAYLAVPKSGKGPGIVLCQEIFGINAYVRETADYYAEEGYVVLAPDLFWRMEPNVDMGYSPEEWQKAFGFFQKFDVDQGIRMSAQPCSLAFTALHGGFPAGPVGSLPSPHPNCSTPEAAFPWPSALARQVIPPSSRRCAARPASPNPMWQDMLREVRMALLEADVALPVVRDFIARVKEKALGQEVKSSRSPGPGALVGIYNRELAATMGEGVSDINLAAQPPAVILMAGLQGAGTTTTTAKLAKHLIEKAQEEGADGLGRRLPSRRPSSSSRP